jgi:hypothetical protein
MNFVIEEKKEYRNYKYLVVFYKTGHRCGYVSIPENHLFYGKDSSEIEIECHGGLTFSEKIEDSKLFENGFWIGFDCAHCYDKTDVESIEKYFGENKFSTIIFNDIESTVRTKEYVVSECKNIINQLIEVEK